MNPDNRLMLHEEILLLALHDDKGTTSMGGYFANAMGGAIFSELVLRKAISMSDDKHKNVSLLDYSLTGNEIIDLATTF